MNRQSLFGLVFALFATMAMAGDGVDTPIGYIVENPSATEAEFDEAPVSEVRVVRDGEKIILRAGDEVYPGDRIATDDANSMSIAFLDHSAIKLFPSTELLLSNAALTSGLSGGTIVQGHASVAFNEPSKTASELNLGVGLRSARASAPTLASPVQLDILVNTDGSGFKATVGVLKGIAQLIPNGKGGTDIKGAGLAIMTLLTPVDKVTGSAEVDIAQGTYTKDQLAALKASAVSEFAVKTGKGSVSIKGTIKNADGTVTTITETLVSGAATKSASTTKNSAKKTVTSYKISSGKLSFVSVFGGFTFKISDTGGTGKGTAKGTDKSSFAGTSSNDPATGKITMTGTDKKSGDTLVYTYQPTATGVTQTIVRVGKDGKATQTTTSSNNSTGASTTTVSKGTFANGTFTSDGSAPTVTTTSGSSTKPPSPRAPDGHAIDQNDPPATKSP